MPGLIDLGFSRFKRMGVLTVLLVSQIKTHEQQR
jgi:hypothetical protein